MRWFKHLSAAHQDPAVSELLEEHGAECYGVYWLLLEQFADLMENGGTEVPSLTRSDIQWAKSCYCSTRKWRSFVAVLSQLRLICAQTAPELRQNSSKRVAKRFSICIPKLLKYRDEYQKKSGHSPDKLRRDSGHVPPSDTDTDTDTENPPDQATESPFVEQPVEAAPAPAAPGAKLRASFPDFERWWDGWSEVRGTNHRRQAREAFRAVVPVARLPDCWACTASYLASLDNPAKGYNPENFLREQSRDDFRARWPVKRGSPVEERKRAASAEFQRMLEEDLARNARRKIQSA